MKEISSDKFYEEYETKGLGDVFSFGEVMNYHFVSSAWANGIAFIEMTGDVCGIFNSWNQKFYLFNNVNTPREWINRQFIKCYSKYSNKPAYDKKRNVSLNEEMVQKAIKAQRAMDY